MDYRDQDSNAEGLFGARNENSVLFSLDNLNAIGDDSNNGAGGTGFGSSGDASGLIDLNTLSKMSGASSEEDGEAGGMPIMESMVFNQVVTKKKKQTIGFVIGGFVLVIAIAVVAFIVMYNNSLEEKEALEAAQNEQLEQDRKNAAELEAQIAKLEREKKEAEAENMRRSAKQEEIDKELARLREAQMNAQVADAEAPAPDGKPGSKKKPSNSGNSGAAAAPAPAAAPKNKAPDKGELLAALKAANTKAQKCGKNGSLNVQFNLSGNSAKGVKASGGSFAGSATEKCILTIVEKHRWPDGTASGIKYTFKL
jgi:hypothetical protein